jgi:hypothetical protein
VTAVRGKLYAQFDPETNQALIRRGVERVASYGYTTAQDGALRETGILDAFVAAAGTSALPIDIVAYPVVLSLPTSSYLPCLVEHIQGAFVLGVGSSISMVLRAPTHDRPPDAIRPGRCRFA